jgi:general L-amino acid transport system permease protein
MADQPVTPTPPPADPSSRYWVNTAHPTPPQEAPLSETGVLGWLHANLFSSIWNSVLTVAALALLGYTIVPLARWLFVEAFWEPIWVNRKLFAVYTYPWDAIWQPSLVLMIVSALIGLSAGRWGSIVRTMAIGLAGLLFAVGLLPLDPAARGVLLGSGALIVGGYVLGRLANPPSALLFLLWVASLPVSVWILRGGVTLPIVGTVWTFGDRLISYSVMGGLLLTILLAVVGIAASFPIGVLLALGRKSNLPIVRGLCVGYIELIRGVPLITLLFMAMIALPLLLPGGARAPENAVRAMVAIIAFESAYLAETVRGGLQAVPHGQYEAADAVGLGTVTKYRMIVLPQALRAVIPAIVGQFISLFKDTSLVALVGLVDLLGVAQVVIKQPEWIPIQGGISREVYVFVALVYFIFSYGMSNASRRLESQLGVGTR